MYKMLFRCLSEETLQLFIEVSYIFLYMTAGYKILSDTDKLQRHVNAERQAGRQMHSIT
jgi:hypothetical protein